MNQVKNTVAINASTRMLQGARPKGPSNFVACWGPCRVDLACLAYPPFTRGTMTSRLTDTLWRAASPQVVDAQWHKFAEAAHCHFSSARTST